MCRKYSNKRMAILPQDRNNEFKSEYYLRNSNQCSYLCNLIVRPLCIKKGNVLSKSNPKNNNKIVMNIQKMRYLKSHKHFGPLNLFME